MTIQQHNIDRLDDIIKRMRARSRLRKMKQDAVPAKPAAAKESKPAWGIERSLPKEDER